MLAWQPFTVPCRPTVAAGTEAPAACGAAGGAAAQQVARPVHDRGSNCNVQLQFVQGCNRLQLYRIVRTDLVILR